MTIYNDFVQLAANIWHYRSGIVDNWHFGPISPPFNLLEVLGYPSNEYFSFHNVQVYL